MRNIREWSSGMEVGYARYNVSVRSDTHRVGGRGRKLARYAGITGERRLTTV